MTESGEESEYGKGADSTYMRAHKNMIAPVKCTYISQLTYQKMKITPLLILLWPIRRLDHHPMIEGEAGGWSVR